MSKRLTYLLPLLLYASSVLCKSPPVWSKVYSVTGTLNIPYAELTEPFTAWYDAEDQSSRIDYYQGMVKTYQLAKNGKFGASLKLVPTTTESFTNVETCMKTDGSESAPVQVQAILPDLKNFKYIGTEIMNGYQCEMWREIDITNDRASTYTIWIRWQKNARSPSLSEPIPVRYAMQGVNNLLGGSHYDHYYLDYSSFTMDKPSSDIFHISDNVTCNSLDGATENHVYTFNPMKEFIDRHTDHVDQEWESFKETHTKSYGINEHAQRKEIFRQNIRYIHSVNRRGLGYTLKVNHLTDRSDLELKTLRGRQTKPRYINGGDAFPYSTDQLNKLSADLPQNYDWRILGAVTPVKDQSVCGSCWSYGSTGAMEGAYFIKTGHLIRFSQQALVDCTWGFGNNGCDGGADFQSFEWIMKHGGIPTEEDYGPYLAQDGYCHSNEVHLTAPITGYVNVTSGDENALRVALFKHGPVSVSIDASHKSFSFYNNGVYYEPDCKNDPDDLDHVVLAIGFGTLKGQNYWLIKNSWSNHWGNQGYVLMSSKNNNCGVMTVPTYVTM